MKQIKWSVYEGSKHLDSGTVLVESERELMKRILAGTVGAFAPMPEKCYRVTAGDCLASVYGDEFERASRAVGDSGFAEEATPTPEGYLFSPPKVKVEVDEGTHRHDWNGDHVDVTGAVYPKCLTCGAVGSMPVRDAPAPTGVLKELLDGLGKAITRKLAREAIERALKTLPVSVGAVTKAMSEAAQRSKDLADQLAREVRDGRLSVAEADQLLEAARTSRILGNSGSIIFEDSVPNGKSDYELLNDGPMPNVRVRKRAARGGKDRPCAPGDHWLSREELRHMHAIQYSCGICKRAIYVTDLDAAFLPLGELEKQVRERLTSW